MELLIKFLLFVLKVELIFIAQLMKIWTQFGLALFRFGYVINF